MDYEAIEQIRIDERQAEQEEQEEIGIERNDGIPEWVDTLKDEEESPEYRCDQD